MTILKDAKLNILSRKKQAEQEAYLNHLSLLEHDDFWEAESHYNLLKFELARRKAENTDFGCLNNEVKEAEAAYFAVLQKYGKTPDSLLAQYKCPLCNDSGVLNGVPCECLKQEVKKLSMRATDRPLVVDTNFPATYPQFKDEDNRHNLSIAELLKRWTEAFPEISKNIVILTGKTGVGKSHLASVVANCLNERGFSAMFFNAQRLNDLFLQSHLAPLYEKEEILLPAYQADLLVIDDLGVESFLQKVTAEYLYTLLSVRADAPILLTTNLTPEALRNRYGERIFSRLFDKNNSLNLEMHGADLRLIKR